MDNNKAWEYSEDEFLTNPVASDKDCTGYSQRVHIDAAEAQSLADLMDVTAKQQDSKAK